MKQLSSLLLFLSFLSSPVFAQKFTDITPRTDLARTSAVKTVESADFDGDGDLDLAISGSYTLPEGYSKSIIGVYKNDGLGNFTLNSENDIIHDEALRFQIQDLDNDGDDDIYFITSQMEADSTKVLYYYRLNNDGNASFTSEKTALNIPAMENLNVVVGDIENDNDYDLLVTGSITTQDSLGKSVEMGKSYLIENNDNTSFTVNINNEIDGYFDAKSLFEDLDNDGDLDLIISGITSKIPFNERFNTVIYLNNGNNVFVKNEQNDFLNIAATTDLSLTDMDLDGDMDLIISGKRNPIDWQRQSVIIFENEGKGNFTRSNKITFENYNCDVELLDYNKDGYEDIFLRGYIYSPRGESQAYTQILINNNGNGYMGIGSDYPLSYFGEIGLIKCLDINNDGNKDLLSFPGENNGFLENSFFDTYLNNNQSFELKQTIFFGNLTHLKSAFLKYDGDDFPDMIITGINETNQPQTKVYLNNNGTSNFDLLIENPFPRLSKPLLKVDDFNNDNFEDVVFIGFDSLSIPSIQMFTKNLDGPFQKSFDFKINADSLNQMETVDINQDGWMDFAITGLNDNKAFLHIFLNMKDGTFEPHDYSEIFEEGLENIQFGIIDEDVYPDILFNKGLFPLDINKQQIKVFTNSNGGGYKLENKSITEHSTDYRLDPWYELIDLDNDGDDDIIANNNNFGTYYSNRRFDSFENDAGNFKSKPGDRLFSGYQIAAKAADFNNDNTEDLFALYYNTSRNIGGNTTSYHYQKSMLVNIDNVLMKETSCPSFKSFKSAEILTVDINADGFLDMMISGVDISGKPEIRLYLNEGTQLPYNVDQIHGCDSTTWINGKTYTSNNFEDVYPQISEYTSTGSTFDCDPRTALYLTMGQNNNWKDTVNATGEFTWIDGNTYYQSNNTATYTLTNQSGCDSTISLNLTLIPLANELESSIALFPNPSGEQLKFDLGHEPEENLEYQIFNTSGLEMKTWESNLKEQVIDISPLPSGTYIIKYQEGLKSESMKFVKR
ncbi:T9SS type A sorting domain-containing protein [Arcticibacterium luteifluviistationis]|uniref:Secretion system C-terminal sorting domain-containing protein n=1 Tax=Arcticibacterium luteifluviistationis TaxID=1784714 RepID=A0A2Z4GDE4_9BACT|nr:T9SS type A sorting domain-containing protein [Arcticibacterium luteifluviistationis]AWV99137.1 hypothetical protein DJ013_13555 [Arcticibacterium luteifluviistationis]